MSRTATILNGDQTVSLPDPRSAAVVREIYKSSPAAIMARLNTIFNDFDYRRKEGRTHPAQPTSDMTYVELVNEIVATANALIQSLDAL
jgi:hypothetical protein